jgi:hypothetical protein
MGTVVPPPPASFTLAEAARTSAFWVLAVAFVVGNFATVSVTVHLIPYRPRIRSTGGGG